MSRWNAVDSSGWLEYFADSARAGFYAPAIEDIGHLVVPVLSIYEVFKKVLRERGEDAAIHVASAMQGGLVVDLDSALAMDAARLPLPLAGRSGSHRRCRHASVPRARKGPPVLVRFQCLLGKV